MNELQVALAVIGVLVIAGIFIYNRFQEHRFRKQTEAGFSIPKRDVLLDAESEKIEVNRAWTEPSEPVFGDSEMLLDGGEHLNEPSFGIEPNAPSTIREENRVENTAQPVQEIEPAPTQLVGEQEVLPHANVALGEEANQTNRAVKEMPHNELIEFKVQIKNLQGMQSEAFADVLMRCGTLEKPVRWRALPLGGLDWEVLQPQSKKHYLEVLATMQLADRQGAASKAALSALCNLAQEVALSNAWQIKCDDLIESLARAQSLDKFCADVDVLIGLNVMARGSALLPSEKIHSVAEAAGMQLQADGMHHLLDSRHETLFTLSKYEAQPLNAVTQNAQETKGMTLLFDVPRVPDGLKTFDSMVGLGRQLANESGAQLVDDNLRPLTDAGIEKIRAQLVQIYGKMESRGIPPGGRLALRLFS